MHAIVGALLAVAGLGCLVRATTGPAFRVPEPPLAALGVVLIAVGLGVWCRSRVARLLALGGLGAALVGIVADAIAGYRAPGPPDTGEDLVAQARLLFSGVTAAAIVMLLLLLRRVRSAPVFGAIDWVPLGGVLVALGIAVAGTFGDDARLRPCRRGDDPACARVATALLEAAERAPTARPEPWEERAAQVLAEHACRGAEPPCGVQLYALGSVAARAGRADAAKYAFFRACDVDAGWCARAAQEPSLTWTPAEQERLARRGS